MRKNSVKNRKVNDVVMRELAQILRDIKDPRVSPMTSVLSVEVAPDLKNCKVWISVLGSPEEGKRTMEGIRSANGFIRSELAHRVNLRNTPELHFILDDSIAYGVEMGHKLHDVTAADAEADRERRADGLESDDLSGYDLGDDEDQNL